MYENKSVLITGGTGSWGHELVKQLLARNPKEIRIFSRGELAQVNMQRFFNEPKLKFIIGDIRDESALIKATQKVDYVFHLAALKHVPICEEHPLEAVKTNIMGTQNLINACILNHVKKVIDVSTDKAVDSLNLYGMTKAVGEKLIIQANQLDSDTQFVCIRGGNVLGSNGSVVPLFMNQLQKNRPLTITNRHMTRYFITLPEAISLLFKGVEASHGGETFVMRMPSYYIHDIAQVMIQNSNFPDTPIQEIGMRPGEKLHEVLISEHEATHTFKYDDTYYLIMPTIPIDGLENYYQDKELEKVTFTAYTSKDEVLDASHILPLLKKGGFY